MNIYGFDDYGHKIKIGEYRQIKPIGGPIFYTDPTADGVYQFYDENLIKTNVLADAKYYEVLTAGTKDKYYVYDNVTGIIKQYWGYDGITTGATTDTLGSGKTNTALILSITDTSSYATNSAFYYLSSTQNAGDGVNGNNDWYIGSKVELTKFKDSGLEPSWFASPNYLWTSVEYSDVWAWRWQYINQDFANSGYKSSNSPNVCFFRSF